MPITLYHNPHCSKSREALALIEQQGIKPKVILYLEAPPSASELAKVIKQLGIHPSELFRFKEDRAKELGLRASDKRSEKEWIRILVDNPVLIERPIVIHGNKALICRPPERVLELL